MSSAIANGARNGSGVGDHVRRAATLSREMIGTAGFDGYFKRVNGAAKKILGYTSEELQSQPFIDFVHIDDRPATQRAAADLAAGTDLTNFENRYRCKDGSFRWLQWQARSSITEQLIYFAARDVTEQKTAAQGLRRQEEQYRLLFETNPSPMWVYDAATLKFLAVNQAAIQRYGYSHAEFLSLKLTDLRPPEDVSSSRSDAPSPHSGMWWHCTKAGKALVVDIYSSPVVFEGNVARMATAIDVTEREAAERRVRESEEALALAQRLAHIGSWEIDLTERKDRSKRPPRWSDEIFRIFGLEPGSIPVTHSTFLEFVHPADREEAKRAYIDGIRTGKPYAADYTIVTRDGTKRFVHVECYRVKDSDGQPSKMAGTIQDITERRRAEELLREQAELLNLAYDAIVVRDMEDRIQFWNKGAERIYGWSAAEVLGKRTSDFLYQDMAAFLAAKNILLEKNEWTGESKQRRKDGGTVIFNSRWTLVSDEYGRAKSILVINQDITEQKKFEAQLLRAQRLESVGTLASGVAHDLNNILTPILLTAPLLRNEMSTQQREALVSLVVSSAERGAGIVRQVLTFARGAEGDRVLIQPAHLIKEIERIARETFPKSVLVRTDYAENLWTIEGEPTQIHQVLLNLSVNARDAMPQGGTLSISAENIHLDDHFAAMTPDASAGPHVVLKVSDTGAGIPPGIIDKIFDPFFTTKEVGTGTGLGLSTVIGIVKSHGGFVNVYSEPGATTFKVFLPASSRVKAEEKPSDLSIAKGQGETILVVDDEPNVRLAAEALLLGAGYKVLVAEDGTEAVAAFMQHRDAIKVLLTDVMMPFMDGPTLVRTLRRINPDLKVIVSTGRADNAHAADLEALRVQACVAKPYTKEKLLSTLEELLKDERELSYAGS